jgi:hypothetical protein
MSALNGQAWSAYANGLAAYLEGDTPDSLVPVAPLTGDALPFVSDSESQRVVNTESGALVIRTKVVFVRALRFVVGDRFTYGGITWQVASFDPDRCAGHDWPHQMTLVSNVSNAAQEPNV